MLKILQYIMLGHIHKWKIIESVNYEFNTGFEKGNCTKYTLQCETCGKLKTKVMK